VVTAVSNVVNYDVTQDGGAVFNVVNPLGQFRLVCTEDGCGYLLLASDGSLQVMAPWKGGEPTSAPAAIKVEASATKLSVDDEVTVTATVTDHLGRPVANTNVNFVVETTGLANPGIGSATTDGQGKATFKFKQQKVGKDKVTATATAGPVSGEIEIEWTAGAPKTVDLTVDKNDPQIEQTVTFTATVKDQYGNLVPGVEVAFTTDATSVHPSENRKANTGTSGDDLGKATLAYTGNTKAGTDRWKATAGTATSSELTVTWKPGAPDSLTLEVDKKTPTVGDTVTFTATVKDKHGNPIPNLTVSFATTGADDVHDDAGGQAPTNASGVATYQFTDDTPLGTGTDHWTASIADGPSAGVDVVWRAGNPRRIGLTVQDDKTSPKAGESVTLTATVYDAYDNVVDWFGDNGEIITFRTASGAHHPKNDFSTATDGVATLQISETTTGEDTWEAVRDAITSNPVPIDWQPGDFTKIALTVNRTSQTVGSNVQFTATLQDDYGNTVDIDDEVTFVVTKGSNVGLSRRADAVNGVAVRAYGTNQTEAGDQTWKATYGDVDSNEVTVTWLAGPAAKVALEVDDTNPSVNGQIKLTARVLDDHGNLATNASGTVTFETINVAQDQSSVHPGVSSEVALSNGVATWYFTGGTKTGVDHWQATFDGLPGKASDPVVVTWKPGPVFGVTLTPATTTATAGDEVALTASLVDQWGNVVPEARSIEFEPLAANVNPDTKHATTTDPATGEATFKYTGEKAGLDRWRAVLPVQNGDPILSNEASITWNAGDPAKTTLSPASQTAQVKTNVTLTAIVVDQFDNPVEGVQVTLWLDGSPSSQVGTPVATDSNGQTQFTYTSDALGDQTLKASFDLNGTTTYSGPATVTWVAGPINQVELEVVTTTPKVGGEVQVRAQVKDGAGYPVADAHLSLFSLPGSANSVDLAGTTGTDGTYTFTYTDSAALVGQTDTLMAAVGVEGGAPIHSTPVTVTWQAGDPAKVELTASATSATADDTVTLTAAVRDADGNSVDWATGDVTFTVDTLLSDPDPDATSKTVTVALQNGKAVLTLTGKQKGTETWTASYGTFSGQESITWSAGAPASVTLQARESETSNQLIPDQFVIGWDKTVEFRVVVRDAKGNGVPNLDVTIQTTGGTAHHNTAACSSSTCKVEGTTAGGGGFTGTFKGQQAGYDDWSVTVNGHTATIRIVWEPVITITSDSPKQVGSTIALTVEVTGFQCTTLATPTPADRLVLIANPSLNTAPQLQNYSCGSVSGVGEKGTWNWNLTSNGSAETVQMKVTLKLDGDNALDTSIGEVEKSVTVEWKDTQ